MARAGGYGETGWEKGWREKEGSRLTALRHRSNVAQAGPRPKTSPMSSCGGVFGLGFRKPKEGPACQWGPMLSHPRCREHRQRVPFAVLVRTEDAAVGVHAPEAG